jgi:hypothetical protein
MKVYSPTSGQTAIGQLGSRGTRTTGVFGETAMAEVEDLAKSIFLYKPRAISVQEKGALGSRAHPTQ